MHRAAIRYLHRAAGSPVPVDDTCVSKILAGITRDAARKDQVPQKKVAATATILRRLLAPIPANVWGLRDRAIFLVGFAGALRRPEFTATRFKHLKKTDRSIRLSLPQAKGEQTDATAVPLPYGDTELCPVRTLELWQSAPGLSERPVFRWYLATAAPNGSYGRPLPCPASVPRRSRRRPWPRLSKPAAWLPVLAGLILAAMALIVARSPWARIAVFNRPN